MTDQKKPNTIPALNGVCRACGTWTCSHVDNAHNALRAEVERLREKHNDKATRVAECEVYLSSAKRIRDKMHTDIDALRAEVERLRRERDHWEQGAKAAGLQLAEVERLRRIVDECHEGMREAGYMATDASLAHKVRVVAARDAARRSEARKDEDDLTDEEAKGVERG